MRQAIGAHRFRSGDILAATALWSIGPESLGRPASARYGLPPMSRTGKDMDRWLGDGGMPIIAVVGGAFADYGVDGEDLGWVTGTFAPTAMASNPHGITQAGVHSLLLDACMNFAINAALPGKARTRGTLELKTECMRPAMKGEQYLLRGEVARMAKQIAYGEATVRSADGLLVSRATGTFLLHRPDAEPDPAT